MSAVRDVVVVGGGPAGLALAVAAAGRGLSVTVLERAAGPVDKACGEGLLPAGARALHALGVSRRIGAADRAVLREIRWMEPRGGTVRLALPEPGGLGIRRTALWSALRDAAVDAGAEVVTGADVRAHGRERDRIWAECAGGGAVAGRVLVAADGLGSRVRRREGLERPAGGRLRFGIRKHFAVAPWADAVEVHFGDGAEAYVTPAGRGLVCVAILFERDGEPVRFEDLLARFPPLERLLSGVAAASVVRGAGPLARAARARVADRLVLLGDAAGYLDAVTGEGLSLALGCAVELAALLPGALAAGAGAAALAPYERVWRRHWRPYAAWTRLVLALARHPGVRRQVVRLAAARPGPFERLVAAAVG